MKKKPITLLSILCISLLLLSNTLPADPHTTEQTTETITIQHSFSYPTYHTNGGQVYAYVEETNLNMVIAEKPVLPAALTTLNLPFGSTIKEVTYTYGHIKTINLTSQLATATQTYNYDSAQLSIPTTQTTPKTEELYPTDWIATNTGAGISNQTHYTYLTLRAHPLRYNPTTNQLLFISNITITINYQPPQEDLLNAPDFYDLLIITPESYKQQLTELVEHKENHGIRTQLATTTEIYDQMFWQGRDHAEQIKYFIKNAVEHWNITHVLLVGGLKGQTTNWNIPIRESHVVPPTEQEYPEQSFISDLYYADLYNADGSFSTWDSNYDSNFSVWNQSYKEEMDLYPDVYLGRLPCRSTKELSIMIDKIITYETETYGADWFNNYLIVAGDSYQDTYNYNEGELIGEASIPLYPGCNPLRVYASLDDINRKTVNSAYNQGAGFAYFCGHGSPGSWSTHFPPDGERWTTGYENQHMKLLRNGDKMPIVFIGGCHNGQFDVGIYQLFSSIRTYGILGTFLTSPYKFFYNEWRPNCWAWEMVSHKGGGAIAAIGNTGLGTHGDGDLDDNDVADYLEVLNGWMELRFLEMYGIDGCDDLGENHGDTITEYLHRFIGNDHRMDTKMAQQWELFGDPTLKIGGYLDN